MTDELLRQSMNVNPKRASTMFQRARALSVHTAPKVLNKVASYVALEGAEGRFIAASEAIEQAPPTIQRSPNPEPKTGIAEVTLIFPSDKLLELDEPQHDEPQHRRPSPLMRHPTDITTTHSIGFSSDFIAVCIHSHRYSACSSSFSVGPASSQTIEALQ
jgi:hypothetical protein